MGSRHKAQVRVPISPCEAAAAVIIIRLAFSTFVKYSAVRWPCLEPAVAKCRQTTLALTATGVASHGALRHVHPPRSTYNN